MILLPLNQRNVKAMVFVYKYMYFALAVSVSKTSVKRECINLKWNIRENRDELRKFKD